MKYNVCLATDNNYVQHLAVAVTSLLYNNKSIIDLDIYVLGNNLSTDNIYKVKSLAKEYEREIKFIDVSNLKDLLVEKISVNSLSITTYTRLFLVDLLPKTIDKLLYLDCDVIVEKNIEDLWKCNIQGNYVAGVQDTMFPEYYEGIGLPKDKFYVNAGVLFINLKKWREENVVSEFLEFIRNHNGNVPHLDQGVINGVFTEKVILDLKYNVQTPLFIFKKYKSILKFFKLNKYYSEQEWKNAINNASIIHFSSSYAGRPWFKYSMHPKRNRYRYYKKLSPFKENRLIIEHISIGRRIKNLLMIYFQSLFLKIRMINEK